ASRQASGIPGMAPTEEKDGNLPDIVSTGSLHQFLVNLHEKYGSLASFWFGQRLVVSLGSIDVLKEHINPNRTSDPFETMLKSLLGYQSGFGGNAAESHVRKKVYETGVDKAIQSNFTVILKIWSEIGKGFLDGSLDKSSPRKQHYEEALGEMEATLRRVAKERKEQSNSREVFMDSLLQGDLSEKQVLEDSMIFSLAGCVITANLCIWATYFLATSRSVQEKLYRETVRTAKLTPVAAQLQELEGSVDHHIIPKETLVIYALGVVLQDETSWQLPYRFDPERFNDEAARKQFTLLGFSGNQECPELRFAYTVATIMLSTLIRKLSLHPVADQVVEMKYDLVTTPKEEAWITVSKKS
ncbi:hypothetical protein scyTo_0001661, partial [Scyliorhinus torazame]|nr:hypothetical protein [Scyliorhinus torazame]